MQRVPIKPLSVNEAYRGRRFDTPKKKQFVKDSGFFLPNLTIPSGPLSVTFVFGFSNKGQDIDGPIKPCLDILQKRYDFNDNRVYDIKATKVIVPKGQEFWAWEIVAA
jgi:Holliday junction resolvase RusA-like endonuclease